MLSKMNFANLLAYTIQPSDMELFQTYMLNRIGAPTLGSRTAGLIYGGAMTWLSGLTVRVSAGLAIMPDGQFIEFPQTDITLGAAHATLARYDRVELNYTLTNGTSVVDVNAQPKVLDKHYTPSIDVSVGTPAASPTVPALTAAKVQIGYVQVPAAAINLSQSVIFQLTDNGYLTSYIKLGNSQGYIRHNNNTSQLQFSNDGITWQAFGSGGGGGGGAAWQPGDGLAPEDTSRFGERVFLFEKGAAQSLTIFIKAPASYISGMPIKLRLSHFSPSAANVYKFQTLATLIRKGVDAFTSTANQRTSTNADVTNTVANLNTDMVYDITTAAGLINGLAVSAGDMILVTLSRVAPSAGTEDTAAVGMFPSSTEMSFS